jgi:hypothetical protein
VIVPTSLRDVLGLELNNTVDVCLMDDCRMIFRARVVAFVSKMPMFTDIRGYRPNAYTSPGVIITQNQMDYVIKEYLRENAYDKERVLPQLRPDYGLPHSRVAMRIDPEATDLQRSVLKNDLQNKIGRTDLWVYDSKKMRALVADRMSSIQIFNLVVAIVVFILALFQIIVSQ